MKRKSFVFLAALALSAAAAATVSAAALPEPGGPAASVSEPASGAAYEQAVARLVNTVRTGRGLAPLRIRADL